MRKNLPNPLSLRFVVPWQSFKYRAKNDAILFHGRVAGRMGRTAIVTSTREHRSFASHVFLVCCREKVSYLKVKLPEMPSRCVVGGCSNTPDLERGIALHTIPFHRYKRPMAKKRRKRWVDDHDEAGKVGAIEDIGDLFGTFPARGFPASVFEPAWPNENCNSEAEPRRSRGDSLPHHTPFDRNSQRAAIEKKQKKG